MAIKNKYVERSKITEAKFRQLIKLFAHDLDAQTIASLANPNRNTVNRYLTLIRTRIAEICESQSPLKGEIEVDESYFGGKRIKGKRGRGAYKKTPVFGIFKRGDKVYTEVVPDCAKATLQAVVDTYGSVAFGKLCTSKRQETAADVLYDRVLPFYKSHGLTIEAILTDNGTEYKGRPTIHLYEIFLELNDIEHRTTKVASPRTNGFVERFNRTVLDEFFRTAFRKKLYESVDALQEDLDAWLHEYNHDRPHRGYRNQGRRPLETFELGKVRCEELLKEAA